MTDEGTERDPPSEAERIFEWRLKQALDLGIGYDLAHQFASSVGDLGKLRKLVADGCPPDTAAWVLS